jgi:hypothetical protein
VYRNSSLCVKLSSYVCAQPRCCLSIALKVSQPLVCDQVFFSYLSVGHVESKNDTHLLLYLDCILVLNLMQYGAMKKLQYPDLFHTGNKIQTSSVGSMNSEVESISGYWALSIVETKATARQI